MAIGDIIDDVTGLLSNPITAGVSGVVVGVAAGSLVTAAVLGSNKSSSSKNRKRSSKGRARDRKFKSKQKWEQRYKRKRPYKVYKHRKSKGKKRVGKTYYTKKGQPYKILSSGKARFIKK
jgi:DNA repair photolyase